MTSTHRSRWPLLLLLPVIYAVLAAIGIARAFSPIPFWDMWEATLGFVMRVSDGDYAAWWTLHNEHRILLTRLLFWADSAVFDQGRTPFLVIMNFLLAGFGGLLLVQFARRLVWTPACSGLFWSLASIVLIFAFAWAQENNLTWAFQSQFFLAQSLPLAACYLMGTAMTASGYEANLRFVAACFVASLCGLTMGNGLLAMPVILVATVLAGQLPRKYLVAFAVLTILVTTLYLVDYRTPGHHGSPLSTIRSRPFEVLKFLLLYLGSPAWFLAGRRGLTTVVGLFVLLASLWLAWSVWKIRRQTPLAMMLLGFVVYLGGSALATSGGRVVFGMEGALASRYTTPVLMLWSSLLILAATLRVRSVDGSRTSALIAVPVLVAILALPHQLKALKPNVLELEYRGLGAVALALSVRDPQYLRWLYPEADVVLRIARDASRRGLSVFGGPALSGARADGLPVDLGTRSESSRCLGSIDEVEAIEGNPEYVRIRGWLWAPDAGRAPAGARVLDEAANVIGHVATGWRRPDVAHHLGRPAGTAGFYGYVRMDRVKAVAQLVGQAPGCVLPVRIHLPS